MNTIAIFGVGLIGGSFAMALRKAGFAGRILGAGSESTLARAQELRIIDAGASPEEAAGEADVIYLSQPIGVIIETLPKLNAWVRPNALVTDAGSTKQAIVEAAAEHLTRAQFLGGHPMAGKERRGVDAAEADLFRGRTYLLTPDSEAALYSPAAINFQNWLKKIGCEIVVLSPAEHDEAVAFTSHLPQLASIALSLVLSQSERLQDGVFGPALVEATRLSLSPYEIWGDILATNAPQIDRALAGYIEELERVRKAIGTFAMAERFHKAAQLATSVRNQNRRL